MHVTVEIGILIASFICFVHGFCKDSCTATTSYGVPLTNSQLQYVRTVGPRGPLVMEDVDFLDKLTHFVRERIPPRVVHAKGVGAGGYFEVTKDISKYCAAKVFSRVGKKTPIFVRYSSVLLDRGAADTERDIRGFAIKFYTEDGIWDLVGNALPVFFIRDPKQFPDLIHALKRHPSTNLMNATTYWDFLTLTPESSLTILLMFSDLGTPYSFRHVNGYGVNTFKLVNSEGRYVYCKFKYVSGQGLKSLTSETATKIKAIDPDYYQRDMYDAIASGNYPSWTFYIQVMTQQQVDSCPFDPFDDTKVWPENEYPFTEVGKFVLNRNPINYFAEVEQIGFSPSRMVPGILPSVDKMLQGRLFAYLPTQVYRLGTNYLQLPINKPLNSVHNYERDGKMTYFNQGDAPNYFPNSFAGPTGVRWAKNISSTYYSCGKIDYYSSRGKEVDDFFQATQFYRHVLSKDGRKRLINNLANSLKRAARFIQRRAARFLEKVDNDLANELRKKLSV